MRAAILALFLALLALPMLAVSLSSGGRICLEPAPQAPAFTSDYPTATGTLHLEHMDDVLPVDICCTGKGGAVLFSGSFRQVIDLAASPNRQWLVWSSGTELHRLNALTGEVTSHPLAGAFAISDSGALATWDAPASQVCYLGNRWPVQGTVRGLLFQGSSLLVHTQRALLRYGENEPLFTTTGSLQDVALAGDDIYLSERREGAFHLLRFHAGQATELATCPVPQGRICRTHAPILSPIGDGGMYPFQIGNSYLEIQEYSGTPYLHPGVDFLGNANEEVFAVADGVVKAVLSTGGELYWRVAVALNDTNDECEGYLYAHLNESSITVAEGDSVHAGDLLGTLVRWPTASFHHCHFARIEASGEVWSGAWWTTDDPLRDVTNFSDPAIPVFMNILDDDPFAFRYGPDDYADVDNLNGEVDIIARVRDYTASGWGVCVNRIGYRIASTANPDIPLIEKLSFDFDYPNDNYIDATYDWMCLSTIFARDNTCYSTGNYEQRDYYYILSHADDDAALTENDILQRFDTTQLPDGFYHLLVWAEDAVGNQNEQTMIFYINNVEEEPPTFHNMPSMLHVQPDTTTVLPMWEHVTDDITPCCDMQFSFSCSNQQVHWDYDDTTGELNLWHGCPTSETCSFTCNATDGDGLTGSSTVNLVLVPPHSAGDATPAPRLSLAASPNPFNPSTTVQFSLPACAQAELNIYNAQGQRVCTLLRQTLPAGTHNAVWQAQGQASGVYFARLRVAGQPVLTRKLLLLK